MTDCETRTWIELWWQGDQLEERTITRRVYEIEGREVYAWNDATDDVLVSTSGPFDGGNFVVASDRVEAYWRARERLDGNVAGLERGVESARAQLQKAEESLHTMRLLLVRLTEMEEAAE